MNEAHFDKYPKNKWIELPSPKPFQKEIFDLIQIAYKKYGGNNRFPSPSAVGTDLNYWVTIDIDTDPYADAVIGARKGDTGGTKLAVIAQDGNKESKRKLIKKMKTILSKRGFYAEVNPELADKFGLKVIKDKKIIDSIIQKDKVHKGNGVYNRPIKQIGKKDKVLVGIPKIP